MVKHVRVIWNTAFIGAICGSLLWLRREDIPAHFDAFVLGILVGTLYGELYWWYLTHRITRKERRFGRNRIFVHWSSPWMVNDPPASVRSETLLRARGPGYLRYDFPVASSAAYPR